MASNTLVLYMEEIKIKFVTYDNLHFMVKLKRNLILFAVNRSSCSSLFTVYKRPFNIIMDRIHRSSE